MESKIKISLNILPFGSRHNEIQGIEYPMEKKEYEKSRYIEPLTTHIEKVEIRNEDSEVYSVPRNTAGA